MSVSIVDYGLGNLGSVANMFRHIGVEVRRVSTEEQILASDHLLLPGVGAFDNGMTRLHDAGIVGALREYADSGRPLLGICLGMQLLFDSSDEGQELGLGIIAGTSRRFDVSPGLRIPHMGWNTVRSLRDDPLLKGIDDASRFYFVHGYRVVPTHDDNVLATSTYGGDFVSMVRARNVAGAQFHPEKSHTFGMTLLRNFAES